MWQRDAVRAAGPTAAARAPKRPAPLPSPDSSAPVKRAPRSQATTAAKLRDANNPQTMVRAANLNKLPLPNDVPFPDRERPTATAALEQSDAADEDDYASYDEVSVLGIDCAAKEGLLDAACDAETDIQAESAIEAALAAGIPDTDSAVRVARRIAALLRLCCAQVPRAAAARAGNA